MFKFSKMDEKIVAILCLTLIASGSLLSIGVDAKEIVIGVVSGIGGLATGAVLNK